MSRGTGSVAGDAGGREPAGGGCAPAQPTLPATGLYRTTITLRTPADWARLEKLGGLVMAPALERP